MSWLRHLVKYNSAVPDCSFLCVVGFIIGFVMTLSNFGFMAAMLAFFIAGSKVTKWRSSYKRKFEADFKEGHLFVMRNFYCH